MLGSKQRFSYGEPLENLPRIHGPNTWFDWTHPSDLRSLWHQSLSSRGTSEPQDGNMPLWTPFHLHRPLGRGAMGASAPDPDSPSSPAAKGGLRPGGLSGVWLSITHEEIPNTRTPQGLCFLCLPRSRQSGCRELSFGLLSWEQWGLIS